MMLELMMRFFVVVFRASLGRTNFFQNVVQPPFVDMSLCHIAIGCRYPYRKIVVIMSTLCIRFGVCVCAHVNVSSVNFLTARGCPKMCRLV